VSFDAVGAARRLVEDSIAPFAADWELQRRMPTEVFVDSGRLGLNGLLAPTSLGGAGLGPAELSAVLEVLAAVDVGIAFGLVVHNNHVRAICNSGSVEQQERYLPDLLAGRRIGAFLLTESGVGSDATSITTLARRDGDGWVIDGEKSWVTNAAGASLLSVYCQTDPDLGAAGIMSFLVEADSPGVVALPTEKLLGGHSMGTGGFEFNGCRVPADAVLHEPGEGFGAAMAGIDLARAMVAAMCCGMLDAGLTTAVDHASSRSLFGGTVSNLQAVRFQLADVATDLAASRLLTADAVARIEGGGRATEAAAHAKKFATRAALSGISECMQAMGAAGLRHDTPLPRHLAGAKITQYIDGTTEIQNVVIARELFGDRQI
jgi:alkylation response protein AidB-like acyl-CoA dehydrogenase